MEVLGLIGISRKEKGTKEKGTEGLKLNPSVPFPQLASKGINDSDLFIIYRSIRGAERAAAEVSAAQFVRTTTTQTRQ